MQEVGKKSGGEQRLANMMSAYSPNKSFSKKAPSERASQPSSRQPTAEANKRDKPSAQDVLASYDKSSSLISRQVEAEAASVDEKIEKLQNLLKMAKGN